MIHAAKIPAGQCRSAFTLLEMVAVMWGLSVLAILQEQSVLVATFKVRRANESAQKQGSQQESLVDQFRADVARANALPDKVDKWSAAPTCLIFAAAPMGPRSSSI